MTDRQEESTPGLRVLIAEDNNLLADSLRVQLERQGHIVIGPAGSVADTMELIHSQAIDVALLDIDLRGETVTPVAKQLRARGCPFMFLSGYGDLASLTAEFRDAPFMG